MTETDNDNGLICAYLLDQRGGGRQLNWDEVNQWTPGQGLLWVHLNFTMPASRRWLEQHSGIDENIVEALSADEGRPRSLRQGDGWLVMLRGVNMNPGSVLEDMVAIRVWLEQDRIISTRRRRLQSMTDLRAAIEAGRAPMDSGEFLVALLDGLSERIENAIDGIEQAIEAAETETAEDSSPRLQSQIAQLRRRCARLRRHLSPQREALDRVARQGGGCLNEETVWMIRESTDQMTRGLEDLDLARERAMVAHEEFVARVAQEQNARVYLLSIVAAIFLPLSFLTGLFGMNVAGLPGLEDPRAFLIVCGLMLGLGIAALVVFRWKRWI